MASELLVNKITPESGNTLTLGDTGDTISFASGVLPTLESLTITGDLTVDTDTLYVDSTNNYVGIGESSPSARLHIANDQGGSVGRVLIDANVTSGYETSINVTDTGFEFTSKSNSRPIIFNTGSTPSEKMRIDNSGNVGIGTTSAAEKLEVQTSEATSGSAYSTAIRVTNSLDYGWGVGIDFAQPPTSGGSVAVTGAISNDYDSSNNYSTRFYTMGSGTLAERMRIDSSGHVIIPNGVTLGTAAGTYNAVNTIDDYEEGTFTATVTIGGVSTGTTISSKYRKIGKLVCYTIFTGSSITKGALTGDIRITGLPFTAASSQANITNAIVRWGGINSGGTVIAYVGNNTTIINLQNYNSTSGFVDSTDSNDVGTGFNIYTVTGFYFTD